MKDISAIVYRGIFLAPSGMWWGNDPLREGYAFSLHTRDEAKAKRKYDEIVQRFCEAFDAGDEA